jgi:PemK-like, MazF-like toxin of type II toxin-antitoxin system
LPEARRLALPVPGEVIRYAYLWTHEVGEGRDEARKDRPCAVVITTTDAAGVSSVIVVAITSRVPAAPDEGMEIPASTRRRLGLQDDQCWAVLTEVNQFVWPGPDLRPVATVAGSSWSYGPLPAALFVRLRDGIVARARSRALRVTRRSV